MQVLGVDEVHYDFSDRFKEQQKIKFDKPLTLSVATDGALYASSGVIQTLEEAAAVETTLDDIVAAWRSGDTMALERELLAGLKDQRELYQSILVRRNRNWARQILEFTRDSRDYLIVVGTLHLVGRDSMLTMLDEQGFDSRQIGR